MTTKKSTLEKYRAKFERADRERVERFAALRSEIRADETLRDIERLAYGMTGSLEELTRAQELAEAVERSIGGLLLTITIDQKEPWLGHKYTIGDIVDPLTAEGNFNLPDDQFPQGGLVVPLRNILMTRDGKTRSPEPLGAERTMPLVHYELKKPDAELVIIQPEAALIGLRTILTADAYDPIVGQLLAAKLEA